MPNQIMLRDDGVIVQILKQDMNEKDIYEEMPQIIKLEKQLRSERKPVLGLIDSSKISKVSLATRKASVETLNQRDYDKLAIFGVNSTIKFVAGFILQASGKSDRIKIFRSAAEATAWLHGK